MVLVDNESSVWTPPHPWHALQLQQLRWQLMGEYLWNMTWRLGANKISAWNESDTWIKYGTYDQTLPLPFWIPVPQLPIHFRQEPQHCQKRQDAYQSICIQIVIINRCSNLIDDYSMTNLWPKLISFSPKETPSVFESTMKPVMLQIITPQQTHDIQ